MKLKILHIASFKGNIGDNANHIGFKSKLSLLFPLVKFEFTKFEIRSTFRKEKSFEDQEFLELVEKHDMVFFGGGNFFELWVDHSSNNTSVDISVDTLKKITKPFIFYSLGFDISMGYSKTGVSKFCLWLDYVVGRNDFVLSLRNDGSFDTMQKILPKKYHKHFEKIPDGGFFVQNKVPPVKPSKTPLIGVNIAGDMLDIRFDSKINFSYKSFIEEFTSVLENLLEMNPQLKIKFFPHIYKDFKVISDLLFALNEKYARERILVNQYSCGDEYAINTFHSYQECDLILGNRFHSNVCAIGLMIPTIGLLNYSQIEYLYKELDISYRLVNIREKGFSKILLNKIKKSLMDKHFIQEEYSSVVKGLDLTLTNFLNKIILKAIK